MSPRKSSVGQDGLDSDVQRLRETVGLSQADLAARLGFSLKTIHRWERGLGKPKKAVLEYLRRLADDAIGRDSAEGQAFKFVDLFAGIGGLRLGFEAIGGECVFTSEWDRHAQVTYRANFGERHPIAGDIRSIPSELIPAHDVLLAGFPCQPFSIAGVSKKNALGRPHGFACDTQGTLFFELARILRHHKPKAFLLENVKNLVNHDGGRTFSTIQRVLREELGYTTHPMPIDARCLVPQHRERIFIAGFRDFNGFSSDELSLPKAETGPRLRSILHPEDGSEPTESPFTDANGQVADRYYLSEALWAYLKGYAAKHRAAGNGFGYGLVGPDDVARTLSARYYKDGSEILIKTSRSCPRRLTPRECARIMGFDRPGRSPFRIPVSDTQAYRQFGNSVVVPVVEAVARIMKPYILGQTVAGGSQLVLPLAASA
jgi:DNA (cytosine-5)-methyltransferase 1